jgi:TPP-dependent trihydroxycyclohexane-1,2-dione (THcHDO) dehydratase
VQAARGADLLGGAVKAVGQHLAGVGEQGLQAVEVVARHHQVVLQVGGRHQRQAGVVHAVFIDLHRR